MLLAATYNCNEESDVRLLSSVIHLRYLIAISIQIPLSLLDLMFFLCKGQVSELYIMPYDALHFDCLLSLSFP